MTNPEDWGELPPSPPKSNGPSGAFPFAPKSGDHKRPVAPPSNDAPIPEAIRPPSDVNLPGSNDPSENTPKSPPPLINPVTGEPIIPKSQMRSSEVTPPPPVAPQESPPKLPPPSAGPRPTGSNFGGQQPGYTPATPAPREPQGNIPENDGNLSQHQVASSHLSAEQIASVPDHFFIDEKPPPQEVISSSAIVGALGAAGIGAIVWAVANMIPYLNMFGVVLGLIACAVGYGIGETSSYMGGRGRRMGWICVGIAFGAIWIGSIIGDVGNHFLGAYSASKKDMPEALVEMYTQEYNERILAADAYYESETSDETKRLMIQFDYAWGSGPEEISDEQLVNWEENVGVGLLDFRREYPDLESYIASMEKVGSGVSTVPVSFFIDPVHFLLLGLLDSFFAMLLAWWTGSRRDGED